MAAARLQHERRRTRWLALDGEMVGEQQRTADFYLEAGLIKQRLEVGRTFDASFNRPT